MIDGKNIYIYTCQSKPPVKGSFKYEQGEPHDTERLGGGVLIDRNKKGEIIGVDILSARGIEVNGVML